MPTVAPSAQHEVIALTKPTLDRRGLLHASVALPLMALLPAARACEFYSSTLRVTHPWTRATQPGATSAVLCMKFDEVSQADRLIHVASPVAESATMGGADSGGQRTGVDFYIPPGQTTLLAEKGRYVLLTGLRHALEVGRSYPLELGFEKGGRFAATLTVDYARFT